MTRTSAHVEEDSISKFSDLPISQELKKGITELGYVTPTAFQLGIFENFQKGHNVVGQGQSSYGKSLAFSLPMLFKAASTDQQGHALVVCENNVQVEISCKELRALGRYLPISVTNGANQVAPNGDAKHIVVMTVEDFLKAHTDILVTAHTLFLDNLSKESADLVVAHLNEVPNFAGQLLIFGQDTLAAFTKHADNLIKDAVFISNSDQPKMAVPAKHIFHQVKEDEPKPRALLAVMEVYQPKFALITCSEAQECELLSRYLSRYGYRIKIVSEDNDRMGMAQALLDGLRGAFDAIVCQSSLLAQQDLERIEIMINYDMFDRPQNYEHTTQFNKQAPGLSRTIVNLLTTRELGYLGPTKAQCQIDFVEAPLPTQDEVVTLSAKRIVAKLNQEAKDIELGQFEILAQKILEDAASSMPALAFLLRNHLIELAQVRKSDHEHLESPKRLSRSPIDNKRPLRHERGRVQELRPFSAERVDDSEEQKSQRPLVPEGVSRLYVTLGKRDGFMDLASLAQYLSEKSGVDLGHFSGSGMVRDHSAHIEVDDDMAETIIKALNNSERPRMGSEGEGEEAKNPVVCEKARGAAPRPYRRPVQQRRGRNFSRHH